MRALTWQGNHDVRVEDVPDPTIEDPTDAIIEVSSSAICGSDLHLYEVLGPYIDRGDVLGHEPMGTVVEVGKGVTNLAVGDRVVAPFNVSCGHCFMCEDGLTTQCETTQVRALGNGAGFLGYTKLYGIPDGSKAYSGGQAEYLRLPHADFGAMKVPEGPADDRFLYLSDVLPTAWQGVEYADVPDGGSICVLGLGPVGQMACRVALHRGYRVLAVEHVPDRIARAEALGVEVFSLEEDGLVERIHEATDGRGPNSVLDAVGMEAHGAPVGKLAHAMVGVLPDVLGRLVMEKAGIDRMSALLLGIELCRRGGTFSISGVYGGMADPMPMLTMFDKQLNLRMGQANVRRWTDTLMPLLIDDDVLGVDDFASHHLPLEEAPAAYEAFQKKTDDTFKVILKP
jgi:threonine dehydrogenase-like Zn-dependent dehydrogenase